MSELFASGRELDEFAGQLGALISALRRELVRRTAADWSSRQLSTAQVELLLAVEREPGIGVREAAEFLKLAPNTVSTLVRGLTARGLLLRSQNPQDRRAVRLTLSPEAERRFAEWRSARTHVLEEALEGLDRRNRELIAQAMPALRALVEDLGR